MNPDQRFEIHAVCNIGYQSSQADDKCHECRKIFCNSVTVHHYEARYKFHFHTKE